MSQGVFGVDIGGTQLRVALAGLDAKIIDRRQTLTRPELGADAGVETLAAMMRELVAAQGWELQDVGAIGVGAPGPTDDRRGILLTPPNLPHWRDVPLADMLVSATGIPAHLQNDANLAAYGEFRQGAGQGCKDLLYVTVSTGIGGGIIIDGELYSGSFVAGEVGHTVLIADGPQCPCGRHGCLEALASGTAIGRVARERLAAGEASSLAAEPDVDAAAVGRAAARGDHLALDILATAGRYLGLGLGGILNVLGPEILVLGGGAIQNGEALLGPMRQAIAVQAFPDVLAAVRVTTAALGQDSGIVGAVEWAVDHVQRPA